MFDFYGTVVDMQGGLIEAITPYLESKNYTAQPAGRVVTWWRSTTPWTRSVPWYRRSSAWPRSLKLVILSNGDPDMLETGVEFSGTEDLWTRMVSVAEAGAFKPHFNTYATGAKAVNLAPSEVLFVANHAFDCVGAKAVGMHTGPTACSSSLALDRRGWSLRWPRWDT